MRIGIVLFGHLRSYRQTLDSFRQMKAALQTAGDVDVFCHTWDIEESITPAWWKEHKTDEAPPATINEADIVSAYKPQAFSIEQSKKFDEPDFGIESSMPLAGMMSMLYSQRKSFELLKEYEQKNGIQYDVVVKTRYDLLYEIADKFAALPAQAIKNNCLYLPTSNPYELAGAYSDIFALGPRDIIEKYFEFNHDLGAAVNIYKGQGYVEMVPELLMTIFLKNKNTALKEIPNLRIHILRMSGERFQINTCKDLETNSPLCFYTNTADKCKRLLKNNQTYLKENQNRIVRKYIEWVDPGADAIRLNSYAAFMAGDWLPLKRTIRLVKLNKQSKVFSENVIKDFFEMAIINAKYGIVKMMLQAGALAANGYGSFYFKVIKKKITRQFLVVS